MSSSIIFRLPPEVLLQILSYVDAPSLVAFSATSREICDFFEDQATKAVIWRNACILHGLVSFATAPNSEAGNEPPRRQWGRWREWRDTAKDASTLLPGDIKWSDIASLYSSQSMKGLSGKADWKDFFFRRLEIHRSWSGTTLSDIVRYPDDYSTSTTKSYFVKTQLACDLIQNIDVSDMPSPRVLYNISTDTLITDDETARLSHTSKLLHLLLADAPRTVPSMQDVHRIKVDERNGFVLATHSSGGLTVTDMETRQLRWCLHAGYVRGYAHLEYEQGYIVFDRSNGSKEVWRSSSLSGASPSRPDDVQKLVAALANGGDDYLTSYIAQSSARRMAREVQRPELVEAIQAHRKGNRGLGIIDTVYAIASIHQLGAPMNRLQSDLLGAISFEDIRRAYRPGENPPTPAPAPHADPGRLSPEFVPHLVIPVPIMDGQQDRTSAFRFVYPYLLAASIKRAYVWDVRTGEQIQAIDRIQEVVVPQGYPVAPYSPPQPPPGPVLDQGYAATLMAQVMAQDGLGGWLAGAVFPPLAPSLEETRQGKGKEADVPVPSDDGGMEGDGEHDPDFPEFLPFASGFFDENAAFSTNLEMRSSRTPPTSSTSNGSSALNDPLGVGTNANDELGWLRYVELGERWVFVCGRESLRVFARGKEFFDDTLPSYTRTKLDFAPGQLVWRLPSDRIHYGRWCAYLGEQSVRGHWGSEIVRQQVVWDEEMAERTEDEVHLIVDQRLAQRRPGDSRPQSEIDEEAASRGRRRRRLFDEFFAVHVSPDQKHVAMLTSSSRLVLVPWFERVIAAEESMWDVAVDAQLGDVRVQSVYLSYGCGESGSGGSAGRIGVVTEGGIFIVTPYFRAGAPFASTSEKREREVDLTVHRLAPTFMDPARLACISCLQMSDTGLWVNWMTSDDDQKLPILEREGVSAKEWLAEHAGESQNVDPDGDEDEWEDVDDEDDTCPTDPGPWTLSDNGFDAPGLGPNESEQMALLHSVDGEREEPGVQDDAHEPALPSSSKGKPKEIVDDITMRDVQPSLVEDGGKSKKPNPESGRTHRSWDRQTFDLNTTPPSRFMVRGGKCKFNYAETSEGHAAHPRAVATAWRHERRFVTGLKGRRVDQKGNAGQGVQSFGVNGDMIVHLNDERAMDDPEADRSSQVHQIRFVPI